MAFYSSEDAAHVERVLNTSNFYEILQIPQTARIDEIKASYRKYSLLVHPDKNNHPRAKEAFVALRKASAVLLDSEKRQEYDRYLRSPAGIGKEQFDLSEEAVDAILLTAGVFAVVGIAAALYGLYEWFTSKPKQKNDPTYAR